MTKPNYDDTDRDDDPPVEKSKFEIAVEAMLEEIGPAPVPGSDWEKVKRVRPTLH